MQLSFAVWMFVRVMVYLEAHPGLGKEGGGPSLLEAWRDLWEPLDQELGELAQEDFAAYAELMMDKEITIGDVKPAHAKASAEALEAVAKEIATILKKGSSDREHLEFERSELSRKADEIRAGL